MNFRSSFPPATKHLLIINCLCFAATWVLRRQGTDLESLLGLHFLLADDFRPWQLVSYLFLHADLQHLFFNMFSLWMFGRIIEQSMGLRRFLWYYFLCGVGAGLCQELWQLAEYHLSGLSGYSLVDTGAGLLPMGAYLNQWTTIGASGACYGVLLAFGMFYPNERIMLLIPPIPMKAKYFVAGYAVVELFSAFLSSGNIAHFAHLGGMLFGLLLLLWWRHSRGRTTWQRLSQPARAWLSRLRASARGEQPQGRGPSPFKQHTDDYNYNLSQREQEARLDALLEKVSRLGYAGLTEQEKRDLFHLSR